MGSRHSPSPGITAIELKVRPFEKIEFFFFLVKRSTTCNALPQKVLDTESIQIAKSHG